MVTSADIPGMALGVPLSLYMLNFQQVLFPVDFSDRCLCTIPFVKEIVRTFGAKLTLLHVAEFPMYLYGTVPPATAGALDALEECYRQGEQQLAAFRAEHFRDLPSIKTICEWGSPGDAILAHAKSDAVDLIMMPTHGHSPFKSFVLGSVTGKVLHRAACPVWTGAHIDGEPALAHASVKRILCALDLEKDSMHVLQSATALASRFSAEVRLVHCVPAPESGPTEQFNSEFVRFLCDSRQRLLSGMQAEAKTSYEVSVAGGSISKIVRHTALAHETDLVVIGRGHLQSPFSLLRTNAHAIIRDAPCPVMSL